MVDYSKKTWEEYEKISASHLQNIEDGVENVAQNTIQFGVDKPSNVTTVDEENALYIDTSDYHIYSYMDVGSGLQWYDLTISPSVSDGGSEILNNVTDINFTDSGSSTVDVSDDGDGSVSVDISSTDTDTTYDAGSGLDLSDTTFSVIAGQGITNDGSFGGVAVDSARGLVFVGGGDADDELEVDIGGVLYFDTNTIKVRTGDGINDGDGKLTLSTPYVQDLAWDEGTLDGTQNYIEVTYDGTDNEVDFSVKPGQMDWGDLGIDKDDIDFSDLGDVDTTIDMNGNDIFDNTLGSSEEIIYDGSEGHLLSNQLDENSVTVSTGDYLTGGGSVSLGNSISLDVDNGALDWGSLSISKDDVNMDDVVGEDKILNQRVISKNPDDEEFNSSGVDPVTIDKMIANFDQQIPDSTLVMKLSAVIWVDNDSEKTTIRVVKNSGGILATVETISESTELNQTGWLDVSSESGTERLFTEFEYTGDAGQGHVQEWQVLLGEKISTT